MITLKVWVVGPLFFVLSAAALADTVVVPNGAATVPGNANTGGVGSYAGQIYQQIYSSGQFSGPIDITGLSYRAAPGTGPVDLTDGSISIYLAYTPNSPTSMSTTFANNIGMDETLVFSATNQTFSGAGCTGPGPCPFVTGYNFTTPFAYDPSLGNLVLEVVSTNTGGSSGSLDLALYGAASAPLSFEESDAGANALTADSAAISGGLITQFTFAPLTATTPEPATWTMLATAAGAFWSLRRSSRT